MAYIRKILKLLCTALVMVAIFKFPIWVVNHNALIFMTFRRIIPYTLIPLLLVFLWIRCGQPNEKPSLLYRVRSSKIISFLFIAIAPTAILISTLMAVLPYYKAAYQYRQLPLPQNDYWFDYISTGKTLRESIAEETYENYLYDKSKSEYQEDEAEIFTEQEFYKRKQDKLKFLDCMDASDVVVDEYVHSIPNLRFIVCLFASLWLFALICAPTVAKQLTVHLVYTVLLGLILVLFVNMFEYAYDDESPLSLYIAAVALPALLSVVAFKLRMLSEKQSG